MTNVIFVMTNSISTISSVIFIVVDEIRRKLLVGRYSERTGAHTLNSKRRNSTQFFGIGREKLATYRTT